MVSDRVAKQWSLIGWNVGGSPRPAPNPRAASLVLPTLPFRKFNPLLIQKLLDITRHTLDMFLVTFELSSLSMRLIIRLSLPVKS